MNPCWGKILVLAGAIGAISVFLPNQRVNAEHLSSPSLLVQDQDYSSSQVLDNIADRIFYEKHPELNSRKIRPNETDLIQEWDQIRRCDAVVDSIFYQRHPELGGRKIRPDEHNFSREWIEISNNLRGCQ